MPIKPEEALEVFGVADLSNYESVEDFKADVEARWTPLDKAHDMPGVRERVMGKVNQVGRSRLKNIAKDFDLDVDPEVFKKDPLDIIPEVAKALKPRFDEIAELRKKAESAVPDDLVKEWEGKLKAKEKEVNTFKSQAQEFQSKYEELNANITKKERDGKVNGEWQRGLSGVKYHDGVNELLREGFEAKLRKKYQILLNDEGSPFLADATGNPVKHPKKAGDLWDPAEAFTEEAKALKLVANNPHANKPVDTKAKTVTMKDAPPGGDKRPVYIAPPMKVMGG